MFTGIIFPSSSTVTLEILESIKNNKYISVIGVNSHDNYEFKELFEISYNSCPIINERETETIEYLINVSKLHNCNFIIPTMDYAHLILSKYKNIFNENNIKVITSSYQTNQICVSKKNTYNILKDIVDCPKIFNINEINNINEKIFLKPDIGYGSKNCFIINTIEELHKKYNDELLILEYLPNEEYTIDCFTLNSILLYINIRKRVLYKNGLSVITETIDSQNEVYKTIESFANKINTNIKFKGSWFFQVKFDKNNICKLLEISTRIAGASSINRLNGCNLTLLSIYNHFGYPIEIIKNNNYLHVSKIFKNIISIDTLFKYNNVFIDFDDTIKIGDKVNPSAISFLYRCLNHNKDIYLITRHKYDIEESLNKIKLSKHIFKEIITMKDKNKSHYVLENSIFIDDSFKERKDVMSHVKNVLCFDIDFFEFVFV